MTLAISQSARYGRYAASPRCIRPGVHLPLAARASAIVARGAVQRWRAAAAALRTIIWRDGTGVPARLAGKDYKRHLRAVKMSGKHDVRSGGSAAFIASPLCVGLYRLAHPAIACSHISGLWRTA